MTDLCCTFNNTAPVSLSQASLPKAPPAFKHQRAQGSRRDCPWRALGQYRRGGVTYASLSEAACAALMERYIPGFRSAAGISYNVPVPDRDRGTIKTVDFLVKGAFFEFHPPRFWRSGKRRCGDFASRLDYLRYRKELKAIDDPAQREKFKQQTRDALSRRYAAERLRVIRSNPELSGVELIVAVSAADFCGKVIRRFAPEAPSLKALLSEFDREIAAVWTENSPDRRSRGGKHLRRAWRRRPRSTR